MRIVERRDNEVIGEGFGQWEKDCPATVYSLPILIRDVAVQKMTNLYISSTRGLFHHNDRKKVNTDMPFPTNLTKFKGYISV